MPVIYQHRIYRLDLKSNPNITYIFGDNLTKSGLGGQVAEMLGAPSSSL